jgi:hypothetical protein
MKIEIDQSGRVEYTTHDTVVGDSCGNAVWISNKNKRAIQTLYRDIGKPRKFAIELFACLVALTIQKTYSEGNKYLIDTEFEGRMDIIMSYTHIFLRRLGYRTDRFNIHSGYIGKKSSAHETAHHIFSQKKKPLPKVAQKEITRLLFPKKKDRVCI